MSATRRFANAVNQEMGASGCDRSKAVRRVSKRDPHLWANMTMENNSRGEPARVATGVVDARVPRA